MSKISQRRVVIGDVHGHYEGLMLLLEEIAPASDDQIYFLGDLIDRGPQSAQVVEFVKENDYPCLLGNHEQMLLNILIGKDTGSANMQGWLYSGGQATVASYQSGTIPKEHLNWFENLPTYLDLGDFWLTHAGVDPQKTVQEQTAEELCWIRDEFHRIKEPYFTDKFIRSVAEIETDLPKPDRTSTLLPPPSLIYSTTSTTSSSLLSSSLILSSLLSSLIIGG